jgi:protein phosphatase
MSNAVIDTSQPATQPAGATLAVLDTSQQPAGATLPVYEGRLRVESSGLTDVGQVRPTNEDQFLIASLSKALQIETSSVAQAPVQYGSEHGHLFLVADGMGGHAGGEEASTLAVNSIEKFILRTLNWCFQLKGGEGDTVLSEFRKAVSQADTRLFEEAHRHPELSGMGTTVTMAYCFNDELFVAHVGDSRCYLLRDRILYRLTHDHTMVEELVARGVLEPEEAAHHKLRHVITNVVGGNEPGVHVEVKKVPLEANDVVLLCSDGLTEMVPDPELAAILQAHAEPHAGCEALVRRANEQGGRDNITVVVVRFHQ